MKGLFSTLGGAKILDLALGRKCAQWQPSSEAKAINLQCCCGQRHYLVVDQTALSIAPNSGQTINYGHSQTFSGAEILPKAQFLIFPHMVVSRTKLF